MFPAILAYVPSIDTLVAVATAVVAVASFLANFAPAEGFLGKVLHWLALNGPKLQEALRRYRQTQGEGGGIGEGRAQPKILDTIGKR